jgi:integrase
MTLEQIARALYVAEKYRQLPNRGQPKPTSDAALAALWWIVLSGQRTGASMKLLSSRIIPYKEQPGWMIVFPATDMKSRRYHALPVPPQVALLFERAKIGVNRETAWAFPSAKLGEVEGRLSDCVERPVSRDDRNVAERSQRPHRTRAWYKSGIKLLCSARQTRKAKWLEGRFMQEKQGLEGWLGNLDSNQD